MRVTDTLARINTLIAYSSCISCHQEDKGA
jgi:hypothetical protein